MASKTVFITGAARRIGAALARDLHAHGMDIIIHYNTSGSEAKAIADSLNGLRGNSAFLLQSDLLRIDDYTKLIGSVLEFTGRLDVLINNASVFYPTLVGKTTPQQWEEVIGTNMKIPFFLSQACREPLRKTRGCIINIADIHGEMPLKNYPVYSAGKAGLVMLTKALSRELAPDIRVNAVSPGAILWPENMDEAVRKLIVSRTLLKRKGDPQDIADAVRYLIHNADYTTGQILTIDGGRSLYS